MNFETARLMFWTALGVLLYTWLGYPALLFVLERLLYRPVRKKPCEPTVSVLVIANDEERGIARKIENLLALDYPRAQLELVVASDGSHDATADVVRRYVEAGVALREFPVRRGKPAVLNDVVPTLRGEIVVLVDTRQRLEKDVLRKLMANFSDPTVGGVSGELVFEHPDRAGIAASVDAYWRYEKFVRMKECGIHSVPGGTGALFALRRALFRPLPEETILDDVVLPLGIIRRGYRVVMELGARAWDVANRDWEREFVRKARTLSGNFQILFNFRRMGPGLGAVTFQFFSHKLLRLLGPLCLVLLFAANHRLVALLPEETPEYGFYRLLLGGQVAFYALALLGMFSRTLPLGTPLVSLPHAFVVMQGAVVVGLLRYASGRDDALWEKSHAFDPATTYQKLWRLFFDSSLFIVGFVAAFFIRYCGYPDPAAISSYTNLNPELPVSLLGVRLVVPLVILVPMTVLYFFRLDETRTEEMTPEYFLALVKGVFYSTLILFIVIYVRRQYLLLPVEAQGEIRIQSFPTSVLPIGFLFNCLTIGGWRLLLRRFQRSGASKARREVLLLGGAAGAVNTLERELRPPARILPTALADDSLRQGLSAARPDCLLLDTAGLSRARVLDAVSLADERLLPVEMLPGPAELMLAHSSPRLASYIPIIDIARAGGGELYAAARLFANLAAGLGGALASPLLLGLLAAARFAGGGRRLRIGRVIRAGAGGRLMSLPRLRGTAGWPRWWVRAANLSLLAPELLCGRLALCGLPVLSPRRLRRLPAAAAGFYNSAPGLYSLDRLALRRDGALSPAAMAVIYYARNRSLALDLELLLRCAGRRPAKEKV